MIPTLTHLYTQMNKSIHNGTIPGSMDGGGGGKSQNYAEALKAPRIYGSCRVFASQWSPEAKLPLRESGDFIPRN